MGQFVRYIIIEVRGKMLEINGNRCGVAGAQTYLKSKAGLDRKGNDMYREVQGVGL